MTLEQAKEALHGLSASTMDKWGLKLTATIVPAEPDEAQLYYGEVFKSGIILPEGGVNFSNDGNYSLAWVNIGYTRAYYLPIDGDVPLPVPAR